MNADIDWIDRAGTRAKGFRPDYTGDFALERVTSIALALAAELSVVKERLDTVERLLDRKAIILADEIEAFLPDAGEAAARGLATKGYVARVMRGVQQAMEAMDAFDPPMEYVCRELSADA